MTTSSTAASPVTTEPRRPFRLPPRAAFLLLASTVVSLLASSSAPTPLYAVYQAEWGFSPITVTVVFGVYALAVLAALLTVGSLSDHVGRRPVLLVAIGVQAATMLVFATAGGVPELLVARVLQGLATGAAVGAIGAGLLDLDRPRGTIANAVSAPLGTAVGSILSGLLVQFLPAPTRTVYLLMFGIFVVQGVGVALMAETSTRRPGGLASLRPRFALPSAARGPLLRATPALVASWALAGFYGSLGPSLVAEIAGYRSFILSGLALFVLAGAGGVAVWVLRAVDPRTVALLGTVALLAGIGLTLLAVTASSAMLFFAATAVAGAGFGAGFQGAIRTVLPTAAPHERAGVLSVIYLVSYTAMGLPAIIAGVLVVEGGGLLTSTIEYGVAEIASRAGPDRPPPASSHDRRVRRHGLKPVLRPED